MHDIIGDIHGHADELTELLHRLGYAEHSGVFRHPSRQVIFCGDFIDRGPRIKDVLRICRAMCENGAACAVMGNHEFNALAFHTPHPDNPESFLRTQSDKNRTQHRATMEQLDSAEMASALEWFRTLPVSIDTGDLRVVHACWDTSAFQVLSLAAEEHGYMTNRFLKEAATSGTLVFKAIDRTMKGPEMRLPDDYFFTDTEGNRRKNCRIRWFESPNGHSCATYSLPSGIDPVLAAIPVPQSTRAAVYGPSEPPLFIGHYWLADHTPAPLAVNVACVDYGVAKHGRLAGYRFHGERQLLAEHFVTVPSRPLIAPTDGLIAIPATSWARGTHCPNPS